MHTANLSGRALHVDNVSRLQYSLQYISFFPIVTNNVVHTRDTRSSFNVHITKVTSLDMRNLFTSLFSVGK